MMQDVTSKSLREFVTEKKLHLPRFQRAKKWLTKQKFGLCLSVFRGLPCGSVVVRRETAARDRTRTTSLRLLDGRQRLEAFREMRLPTNIYSWSVATLGLKQSDNRRQVQDKFWLYVGEWLGEELSSTGEIVRDDLDTSMLGEDEGGDPAPTRTPKPGVSVSPSFGKEGFSDLLDLILLCHGSGDDGSAFWEPFDFGPVFGSVGNVPEYAETMEGEAKWVIEPESLIVWLSGRIEREGLPTPAALFKWVRGNLLDKATQRRLREAVRRGWLDIEKRIGAVSGLEDRFKEVKVGYIEVTDASPLEEMKIFFLINKGGTPLTFPEILSATSYWNKAIKRPDEAITIAKSDLYERLDIEEPSDTCRWDVAATLPLRWGPIPLFTPAPSKGVQDSALKLGFEFMSGYWRADGGVTKEAYGRLGSQGTVKWESNGLAKDVHELHFRLVTESAFFERLAEWKAPLLDFLPKFVVLDFMLLALKAWEIAGRPKSFVRGKGRTFNKQMVRLFDRLVLETLQGDWRSAGDSRVAEEIQASRKGGAARVRLFAKVDQSKWSAVLHAFKEGSEVGGRSFKQGGIDSRVKTLLRYYYVLKYMDPPALGQTVDWDHIIPQSAFEGEDASLSAQQHRIHNIAMLPTSKNRRKKDQFLKDFTSANQAVMARTISTYEEIPKKSFSKYSSAQSISALKAYRFRRIEQAFGDPRDTWLETGTP